MNARRLYLQAMSRALPLLSWSPSLENLFQRASYRIRRAADYVARPDDIFVVSFPKSGTTLLQMMLYQMTTAGELDFPHIDAVCPWFEFNLQLNGGRLFAELPSPRVFKSHYRRRWLPRDGRFLYIARDLRDVVASAYNHFHLTNGQAGDVARFTTVFLRGNPAFGGSWFDHVASWWPHRRDPNVLFLLYDEVIADLAGTVRRIADFCGLRVDERDMPRIVERCGLAFMGRYEAQFDPRLERVSRRPEEFLREGVPGAGWRELTAGQRAPLAAALERLARELGQPEERRRTLLHPEPQ
jgi:hypothetical protein